MKHADRMHIYRSALSLLVFFLSSPPSRAVNADLSHSLDCMEVFTSTELSKGAKYSIATNMTSITQEQRADLHELIRTRSDAKFLAATALAASRDVSSVLVLGDSLLDQDYRVYALALGVIGSTNAVPYLREALGESHPEYVRDDALIALRMLDHRIFEPIPEETTGGPVRIRLSASNRVVRVGESLDLMVNVENQSERVARITWGDVIFMSYLKFFSPEGHILIPLDLYLEYDPSSASFPKVEPAKPFSARAQLRLEQRTGRLSRWDLIPTEQAVTLRSQDGAWGVNLGPEKSVLPTSIVLVIDYQPVVHSSVPRRLNISPEELLQARVVSNPITIQLLPASSDP